MAWTRRKFLTIPIPAIILPGQWRGPMIPGLEGPMVPSVGQATSGARTIGLVGVIGSKASARGDITTPAPSGWADRTANTPNMADPTFIASDSTGLKLFIGGVRLAAPPTGQPALSTDEGLTFTPTDAGLTGGPSGSGTSSSDGSVLAYCGGVLSSAGWVSISVNSGASWSRVNLGTTLFPISMSGSGTKIVVGTLAGGGVVYISVDTGTSFPSKAAFGTGEWQDVKYSRDGSTVYAAADRFASIGALMKSTDDGATAADVTPNGGANAVSSVCCSADGSYVVAGTTDGHIWTSSNAGGAWTDRGANPDASGFGAQLLVCSDDGQTVLFSGGNNDNAYKSVNGGAIWTSQTPTCMSNPIGSISADGSKMAFSDWSASTGFWVFS